MRGRHIEGPISLVAEAVHVIVSVSRRRAGPLRRTTCTYAFASLECSVLFDSNGRSSKIPKTVTLIQYSPWPKVQYSTIRMPHPDVHRHRGPDRMSAAMPRSAYKRRGSVKGRGATHYPLATLFAYGDHCANGVLAIGRSLE